MADTTQKEIDAWVKSRPASVQKLIAEFPLGTVFHFESGQTIYLIGYNEDDQLIVTETDPADDYDKALREKFYVCASHIRGRQIG